MKWLELSLIAPSEYVEPLSAMFERYGYGGVAEEIQGGYNPDEGQEAPNNPDVLLRSYLPIDNTTETRKQHIQIGIALISSLCNLSPLNERILEDNEWMDFWKNHFSLLRIGSVVIRPSWIEYIQTGNEIVIELDPGMAFGTGHHPTTKMCIKEIEKNIKPGYSVLDIGTGSGILSIVAAKLGAASVLGIDIDQNAIKSASKNVTNNALEDKIKLIHGSITDTDTTIKYDLIVANMYTKVIMDIAHPLLNKLMPDGKFILSGIMKEKSKDVQKLFEMKNVRLNHQQVEGDWAVLVGTKKGAFD